MLLSAIVAMSTNRVIGYQNKLPWHLSADLKYFKAQTLGKPIMMGRKTYESIGKPLPGRRNIVLTRDPSWHAAGCESVTEIAEALQNLQTVDEVMVIGGASLYEALLPKIQRLYLTMIHHEFVGDAYFPALASEEWQEVSREDHRADDINRYDYSFLVLERV